MNKDEYATAPYWGLSRNVKCVNCKHYPTYEPQSEYWEPNRVYYPDEVCPFQCDDPYYNCMPGDEFFCAAFTWGKE